MSDASAVFAEWFAERCWRVLAEATGTRVQDDASVAYLNGKFEIKGGEFLTPFGTVAGSEGYLVQEYSQQTGEDLGSPVAFREDVLRRAQELYGTVLGLPNLTVDQDPD